MFYFQKYSKSFNLKKYDAFSKFSDVILLGMKVSNKNIAKSISTVACNYDLCYIRIPFARLELSGGEQKELLYKL